MMALRVRLHRTGGETGFTLVELLIAMSLAVVLVAVTMSAIVASQDAVLTTKQQQDLNEEARQAINRMARDIRQAKQIKAAVNPDRPTFNTTGVVATRFAADYDGDGCVGGVVAAGGPATCLPYNASNPEDITYCYQPGVTQLYIIDNQASGVVPVTASTTSCSGGQPLLAGNVAGFRVDYRSNLYRYDLNPSDGVTSWLELDEAAPPIGNANGNLDGELVNVDSVVLNVTMRLGGRSQVYRTQVDLRNASK